MRSRLRSAADAVARLVGLLALRERQMAGALTVLTYHRVLPQARCSRYPFPTLAMPSALFRDQVRWLAGRGDVLPLGEALDSLRARRRGPGGAGAAGPRARRLFALTFDDGYEDAAQDVPEILESCGVRGTFFVTTGFIRTGALLWFDRAVLLFTAVGERARREIVLGACGAKAQPSLPRRHAPAWRWVAFLKGCTAAERAAIVEDLELETGGPPPSDGFRGATPGQLVSLRRRGHEIGSHSVTHPLLPSLDDDALRGEIEGARDTLSGWLGERVAGFCYPNGDVDERVVACVERAGHDHACTTQDGQHRPGDDRFRIRRVDVVASRVARGGRRFDPTAFRRELCGLYRPR